MDLHPYDGKQRRFRHDDPGDQAFARRLVERLLRMPIDAAEAWRAKLPDGFLLAEAALAGDIRWLIMSDEDLTPQAALMAFISDHRAPFQAPVHEEMWIEAASEVNSWTVAYSYQGWLHWMSHDQG